MRPCQLKLPEKGAEELAQDSPCKSRRKRGGRECKEPEISNSGQGLEKPEVLESLERFVTFITQSTGLGFYLRCFKFQFSAWIQWCILPPWIRGPSERGRSSLRWRQSLWLAPLGGLYWLRPFRAAEALTRSDWSMNGVKIWIQYTCWIVGIWRCYR